ncbi:MAG: Gfo/Idh/MocA family protein [Thermoguttaceae bacterium]
MIHRRSFLAGSAVLAGTSFLPRRLLAGSDQAPPSETLNVAVIGTGGQGIVNIQNLLKHPDVHIAAICDVADFWDNSQLYYGHNGGRRSAMKALEQHHQKAGTRDWRPPAVHVDFRQMLDKAGPQIDAVLIATPNHTHAVISLAAIAAGKGVYCEKPLSHSVYEARRIAQAARQAKVATQLGNHGHSSDDIRRAVQWIRDGAIGKVRQVHAWHGGPNRANLADRPNETPPVPAGLDWDLWLGPAPERPFHPCYAPLMFHYWWDFGSGTLGNFGCHVLDTAVWALDLEHPQMIEASSTELSPEVTPAAAMYHYRFPARGQQPPVDLFWYDGGLRPPRPDCLEPGRDLPAQGGSLIVGDEGAILSGMWSGSPHIIPEKKRREYQPPEPSIPRSAGHHRDWIDACKGGPPASCNFDYGARLTEIVLLGSVALRSGKTIHWDGPAMKATNSPEAEPFIHGHFRKGWEI